MSLLPDAQLPALQNPQPQPLGQAADQMATFADARAQALQRIQQTRDTAAINQALQTTQGDPDAAASLLDNSGSGTAAMALRTQTDARRKALGDQIDSSLKRQSTAYTIAGQLANTLDSNSTPEMYAGVKQAIGGLMGPNGAPLLNGLMPDGATSDQIPGIVSKINALSDSHAEHVQSMRDALAAFDDGKDREGVAHALAGIPPQQQADQLTKITALLGPQRASVAIAPFLPLIQSGTATPEDFLKAGGIQPKLTEVSKGASLVQTPVGGGTPTAVFTAPQGPPTNEAELAMDAANAHSPTQAQSQAALDRLKALHPGAAAAPGSSASDPKDIAEAIIRGEQPPTLTGLYRNAAPVRAELARQGFPLAQATEDWTATQKYLGTLNGQQQTRLRQAINFTGSSLDIVEDLAKQWDAGNFPALNSAQLALARQGALGPQAQQIATKMTAQIADLTSELGTVYKGGNSSTDESLKLAAQNLQANWSKPTLLANTAQIRKNLAIRQNSMSLAGGAAGVTPGNAYVPGGTPAPGAAPAAGSGGAGGAQPPPAGAVQSGGHAFTPVAGQAGLFTSEGGNTYMRKPDGTFLRIK